MNYIKKMAVVGAFVAASVLSISTASAITVSSSPGLSGFAVTGAPAITLLGTTVSSHQVTHEDFIFATFDSADANDETIIAFRFVNYNLEDESRETKILVTYNTPSNALSFETYWASDTTGNPGTKLTDPLHVPHDGYVPTINFAEGDGAYLIIRFTGAVSGNTTVTLTFDVLNGGTDGLDAPSIPLPPSMVLFGTGLLGLGFLSARRRKKAASV